MAKSSSHAARSPFWRIVWEFTDERLELSQLIEVARHKVVPQHRHTFWYFWGGLTLMFFLVQFITGILLLIYYRPGPEAYESVRRTTYEVDFGWLIRSTHAWSANLMILAMFVHMASVYFMRAYRKPREFGWWSGVILLGLTLAFGFSGYLLPMDELAYFATKVGLEIPASIPLVGPWLADLIRGGPNVGPDTVQRFFALHVVILPMVAGLVLVFHLYLVQRHGNALPPSELAKPKSARRSIPFFPDFVVKDVAMWLIALNILGILVTMFPGHLGPQADPLSPAPEGIHPEWYFMAPFQLLKVLGEVLPGTIGEIVGLLLSAVAGVVLVLIPLYDNTPEAGQANRVAWWLGIGGVLSVLLLTMWGYLAL